jgi:ABC-type phosphate transport system substrate-binding protein
LTFAVHFVYSIPGRPADQDLVLTPTTLKKILNGQASDWTDSDIIIDNPWISSLSPAPGSIQVKLMSRLLLL